MPPAHGSSTVAKIAADIRPPADGSAVHTSLVARWLVAKLAVKLQEASVPIA